MPASKSVNPKSIIGIDIGGANLKYASSEGRATSSFFPMWKQPDDVASTIIQDVGQYFDVATLDALAVTITGELADCFTDREHGVRHLVQQATQAADHLGVRLIRFYGVDGKLHDAQSAFEQTDQIAAANWHALATFVATEIQSDGLLVDIGSTTTDIIPIAVGAVETTAKTDHDRLKEGTLVYVGCGRTPVCSLVDCLHFRGYDVPVMNEWFATMDDAQLLLRIVEEDSNDRDTADGRPRTRSEAANRMARMIGLDHRSCSIDEAESLAEQVVVAARRQISQSMMKFLKGQPIILSGHGQNLVDVTDHEVIHLAETLSPSLARCAPAYAVVRIMQTRYPV
ncbi:MAG: hydantoinase/oxoprolinase family protein [Planctomycetota bacterium]